MLIAPISNYYGYSYLENDFGVILVKSEKQCKNSWHLHYYTPQINLKNMAEVAAGVS